MRRRKFIKLLAGTAVAFPVALPPGWGLLDFENCSCPLSRKPLQKRFLPPKGGSLCVKDVFAKKFLVPGEDSAVGASASA